MGKYLYYQNCVCWPDEDVEGGLNPMIHDAQKEHSTMTKYSDMTTEEFDRLLRARINDEPNAYLLDIPGVYELVAEHYNNDVLSDWDAEQETLTDLDG